MELPSQKKSKKTRINLRLDFLYTSSFKIVIAGIIIGTVLSFLIPNAKPENGLPLLIFLSPIVLSVFALIVSPIFLIGYFFKWMYSKNNKPEYLRLNKAFTFMTALTYSILLCYIIISFATGPNPFTGW